MPPLCAVPDEDDGVPPETNFDPKRNKKEDRKAQQLCAEVAKTLSMTLTGDVRVLSVEPAPDASVLRVRFFSSSDPDAMHARLSAATGALRAAVAADINRKRAPELVFQWAPEPDEEVEP